MTKVQRKRQKRKDPDRERSRKREKKETEIALKFSSSRLARWDWSRGFAKLNELRDRLIMRERKKQKEKNKE